MLTIDLRQSNKFLRGRFAKNFVVVFICLLASCTGAGVKVDGDGNLVHWIHDTSEAKVLASAKATCPNGYRQVSIDHAPASWVIWVICTTHDVPTENVQLAQASIAPPATKVGESQSGIVDDQKTNQSATNANDESSSNTESSAETISAVVNVFGGLLNLKAAKEAAGAARAEQIAAQHAALAAQAAQFAAAQVAAEQKHQAARQQAQFAAQQQAQFAAQRQAAAQQASVPKPSYQVGNNVHSNGAGVNTSITGYATNGPSPSSPPQFAHSYADQCSDSNDPSTCVFNVYVTNQSAAGINCTVSVSLQRYNSATGGTDTLSASDHGYVPAGQTSTISSNIASNGQYSNLQCAY